MGFTIVGGRISGVYTIVLLIIGLMIGTVGCDKDNDEGSVVTGLSTFIVFLCELRPIINPTTNPIKANNPNSPNNNGLQQVLTYFEGATTGGATLLLS